MMGSLFKRINLAAALGMVSRRVRIEVGGHIGSCYNNLGARWWWLRLGVIAKMVRSSQVLDLF